MFGILADAEKTWFLPRQASSMAPQIDWLQWFILWVCVVSGGLVFIATVYMAIRYRHRPGVNDRGEGPTHSTLLEVTWSVIPAIFVVLIAVWGLQGYMAFTVTPPEALEIQVQASKWSWSFVYPNGYSDNQLHLPKGVPVRLVLQSNDVIHSLFMPHMRLKKDVVPGRYNKMWVEATELSPLPSGFDRQANASYIIKDNKDAQEVQLKSGTGFGFDIYCAEYCGTKHSEMLTKVHVHEDYAAYQKWLADASDVEKNFPKPKEAGAYLAGKNGCTGCHSADGSKGTGPTWKDMFGHQGKFVTGDAYTADENYIRESILSPQAHLVEGFGPAMPSYMGRLNDREITMLIAYMKSISANYKGDPAELEKPLPKAEKPAAK
jgi:cytochrome c oxidase subunit 2